MKYSIGANVTQGISLRKLSCIGIALIAGQAAGGDTWSSHILHGYVTTGHSDSAATGVSGNTVIGFAYTDLDIRTPVVWTLGSGGWTTATTSGGELNGVDGTRIVGQSSTDEAYVWGWNGHLFPNGDSVEPSGDSMSILYSVRGDVAVGSRSYYVQNEEETVPTVWTLGSGGTYSHASLLPSGFSVGDVFYAASTDGVRHAGYYRIPNSSKTRYNACYWDTAAGTWTDFDPTDAWESSYAFGVDGVDKVGVVIHDDNPDEQYYEYAMLWSSTFGAVNLTPASRSDSSAGNYGIQWYGAAYSHTTAATAVHQGVQVGQTDQWTNYDGHPHATVWWGSADTACDLHAELPNGGSDYIESYATGVWTASGKTYVSGIAIEDMGSGVYCARAVIWMNNFDPKICDADLAEPFGVLNIFDLQAFIVLYNAQDPLADLAAPFGTYNIFDLQAYIDLYNAGCPSS